MKYKLSGSELAKIMTEVCPQNGAYIHFFQPDRENDLEVRCHYCGLEIDFDGYTCSRDQICETEQPKAESDIAAHEWLDPEFHSSEAFELPAKSGLIESSLFWYYVDSIRDTRIPRSTIEPRARRVQVQVIGGHINPKTSPPYEIETRDLDTGIKRVYIDRECLIPEVYSSIEEYCSVIFEPIARFNVQKLINNKFKREHEAEALGEIENQLKFIKSKPHKKYHRRKCVNKAIFAHVAAYKESRGMI